MRSSPAGYPLFLLFFFLFLLQNTKCFCQQNDVLEPALIKRISALQNHKDTVFLKGLFPSYIAKKKGKLVPDNNIYFTALIAYTLNQLKNDLEPNSRQLVDEISEKAEKTYSHFRNLKGRLTYNFWQTDNTFVYPYARGYPEKQVVNEEKRLPDDLDDTAMILLAMNAPDSVAKEAHKIMQLYTNNEKTKVRGTATPYKNIPAYSVWYGKNFPVIFDVCVSANVLSFVSTYKLQWSAADTATLRLITETIMHNDHIKNPVYVAPYYARTSIILYHISRLMYIKSIPELEELKEKLIQDALKELNKTDYFIEKVILHTSLLRWGYPVKALEFTAGDNKQLIEKLEAPTLPFFVGNLPSYLPNIAKKPLTFTNSYMYNHYCPAYNNALFLEYLVLQRKVTGK